MGVNVLSTGISDDVVVFLIFAVIIYYMIKRDLTKKD